MGNCGSAERVQSDADRRISELIQRERQEMERTVKILVLGAGESGKSTLVKQMKILHGDGYTKDELMEYRVSILENIRESVCNLTGAMGDLGIAYENKDNEKEAELFSEQEVSAIVELEDFTPEMATAAKSIWADAGIQKAYEHRTEFHLIDSCAYFLNDLDRIYQDDFEPIQNDALQVRVRTTGILETNFRLEDLLYKMIDVGGQRSERRKWIQCFDDVTAIIFIAAISGYDMMLFEDSSQNRLMESVDVFRSTFQSVKIFAKTNCILFLNKYDLFEKKMKTSSLKKHHPDYQGEDGDCSAGREYIFSLYEDAFKMPEEEAKVEEPAEGFEEKTKRSLYHHFTTATDTKNIKVVFAAVNDVVVQINLHECGLL